LTIILQENFEPLQFLRYKVGQYAAPHTDYVFQHRMEQQGARILTVLMYWNEVEEGGGTHFSHLNFTITPKAGRALIWPSVLNEDPTDVDERTGHASLPVVKGAKYGTVMC
jgi:prolyl 4-hydroxylase